KTTAGAGQYSLFGNDTSQKDKKAADYQGYLNLENVEHFYQTVKPGMATRLFLEKLMAQETVCFDTETTSLNTFDAQLVGIAFSWEKGKGYYLPLPENQQESKEILKALIPFFTSKDIKKVGQNLKYDIKVLMNYDIEVKGPLFDTMLAHYIINPDMRHNMDVLAEPYLT